MSSPKYLLESASSIVAVQVPVTRSRFSPIGDYHFSPTFGGEICLLNRRLFCHILSALILGLWAGHCPAANHLLIDDFSIDQTGFVTDRFAAFDLLEDPRLFAGGREIWGGGANNSGTCATCNMNAIVNDGVFKVTINDIPNGAANVTWPALFSTTSFDISDFSYLTFDVVRIEGIVDARVNFTDRDGTLKSVIGPLSSIGAYSFRIPSDLDTQNIQSIGLSFLVGARRQFAITSVELAVPEPPANTLAVVLITGGLGVVRLRRVPRRGEFATVAKSCVDFHAAGG